jgi:hypothetical protein
VVQWFGRAFSAVVAYRPRDPSPRSTCGADNTASNIGI